MIRNIVFDLGGVIMTICQEEAIKRFKSIGLKNVENYLNPYTQTDIFGDIEEGKISAEQFREKLSEPIGKEVTYEECKFAWLGYRQDVPLRNLDILLHFAVALYNVYVDFVEKILTLLHDTVGLLQKRLYQISTARSRGINGNHKILDLIAVFIFQWLYQRHISISIESVGIIDIIKFIVIYLDCLTHHHELFEKSCIIIAFPGGLFQILFHALRIVSVLTETP